MLYTWASSLHLCCRAPSQAPSRRHGCWRSAARHSLALPSQASRRPCWQLEPSLVFQAHSPPARCVFGRLWWKSALASREDCEISKLA